MKDDAQNNKHESLLTFRKWIILESELYQKGFGAYIWLKKKSEEGDEQTSLHDLFISTN